MKKIIALFVFVVLTGYTFAQSIDQSNVPAVALNAFQLKFPNAKNVKWKLDKGIFQIKFDVNEKANEIVMDDKGNLVKHKQDLWESEIPENILKTVKSKVHFFDLNDADMLTEEGNVVYEISLKSNDKDHDFLINEKGMLLKYERELKSSEISENIIMNIKNSYGSLDIDDANYKEEGGNIRYFIRGDINDKEHKFLFDEKANLLRHEQDLRTGEIPASVMNAVLSGYKGFEIRDADLKEEGGEITYYLELRKSKEKVNIVLNQNGVYLKK